MSTDTPLEMPLIGFRFHIAFHERMLSAEGGKGDELPLCQGAFSECSGLEATMEPKAIKEGGRNWGVVQRMGPVSFATVILKRGLTLRDDLWAWFSLVGEGAYAQRIVVTVTQLDHAGDPVFAWRLLNALPVKFKAPDLNATAKEVAIEELHLAHEGLERLDLGKRSAGAGGAS